MPAPGSSQDSQDGRDRRAGGWLLALGAAALAAALAPALAGSAQLTNRDLLQNYWPMKAAFWEEPGGLLPLWNWGAFGGSSVLADLIQQPFYLPNLAFRWLSVPAIPGLAWYLLLHALFAHWGLWLLLRRAAGRVPAAAGALAVTLSGYALGNFANLQFACALAWVPWALLAADRLAERPHPRRAALLALAAAQATLAGDPQTTLVLAGCVLALVLLRRRAPLPAVAGALLAAGAGVLALAAPQLWATFEALPGFARGEALTPEVRGQWSFHLARLPELWTPRLFGPLFEPGFWGAFTVSGPWQRNHVHSAYLGALLPALAGAALLARRRAALALVAGGGVGLWLALGPRGLLEPWVARLVPTWQLYRYPERLLWLPTLAGAALVAVGLEALFSLPRARRLWLVGAALAAGAGALLLTAALAPGPAATEAVRGAQVRTGLQLLLVLAAGAVACAQSDAARGRLLLVLVLLADLWAANGELLGLLPRAPFQAQPWACAALGEASRGADPASFRVFVEESALEAAPDPGSARAAGLPRWGARRVSELQWGKRNLLRLCGYRYAVGLTSLEPTAESRLWRRAGPARTLRALATRFAVAPRGSALERLPGARRVAVQPEGPAELLELPAAPRLYRPERVEALAPAALLERVRDDPRLLEPSLAALDAPADALSPHQPAESTLDSFHDAGAELRFRVRHAAPGYWVLADTLDASWQAEVDGGPAALVGADLVHRALWLPAGAHEVVLRCRPRAVLALAGLSWALLAAGAALALGVRRRPLTPQGSGTPGGGLACPS